jgi:hypothetical protein
MPRRAGGRSREDLGKGHGRDRPPEDSGDGITLCPLRSDLSIFFLPLDWAKRGSKTVQCYIENDDKYGVTGINAMGNKSPLTVIGKGKTRRCLTRFGLASSGEDINGKWFECTISERDVLVINLHSIVSFAKTSQFWMRAYMKSAMMTMRKDLEMDDSPRRRNRVPWRDKASQ